MVVVVFLVNERMHPSAHPGGFHHSVKVIFISLGRESEEERHSFHSTFVRLHVFSQSSHGHPGHQVVSQDVYIVCNVLGRGDCLVGQDLVGFVPVLVKHGSCKG